MKKIDFVDLHVYTKSILEVYLDGKFMGKRSGSFRKFVDLHVCRLFVCKKKILLRTFLNVKTIFHLFRLI